MVYNLNMNEEWRICKDFEDYAVSNLGRIYSLRRNTYNKFTERKGAISIQFHKDGKIIERTVARVVAQAFILNPNNLKIVLHKDGDCSNNRVDNLEWGNLSRKRPDVSERFSKPIKCLETGKVYPSVLSATKDIGATSSGICSHLKGHTKSIRGFHFIYV